MSFLLLFIQTLLILLVAPAMIGLVRFFKARLQGRRGAHPFLTYFTFLTLCRKEMVMRPGASFVFRLVPFVVLAVSVFLAMVLPLFTLSFLSRVDVFILAGVLLLGSVFLVLGGLDSSSAFGGMGSSREMTISALVEPALIMAFASLAFVTGTLNVSGMIFSGTTVFEAPSLLLTLFAFVLVALAENARYPVDNPATHLELTMVHEAMILEYSGPYLAMLEYASSIKLTIFALLLANIAVPFGLATTVFGVGLISAIGFGLLKLVIIMALLALLETLITKMRFYRMQEFMTGAFFLAFAGMVMALLSRL